MGHAVICRTMCEKYGLLLESLSPSEMERYAAERANLVYAILICWEEYCRAQTYSVRMLVALTPVWAYFKELGWSYVNEEWLAAKCQIAG